MSPRTPKPSGRRWSGGFDTGTDLRRRPGGVRSERRSYLILCEGKTEKLYFTGMRSRRGPQLAVDVPDRDHLGLVQEAIRRRTVEYDEVWCVLDTELDAGMVGRLKETAAGTDVELALSSPCFELWLILHHVECSAPFQTAEHAKKELARLLPGWSEAETSFADFAEGVRTACERARRLDPTGEDHLKNPSTCVWRLVERIQSPPDS